jgi:hypothetical protein
MSEPFIFIATNKVGAGKAEDERRRAPGWITFIQQNEPRLLAFHEYLSEDGTEAEFVQVHPDVESFEHHMRVLAERSDMSYTDTLEGTTSIRIYGTPSEAVLEMLARSAGPDVAIMVLSDHLAGFTRT